jgi:hypothetical protein
MAAHTFSSSLRAAKRRGNPYGPWMAFRHAFALAARNDDSLNQSLPEKPLRKNRLFVYKVSKLAHPPQPLVVIVSLSFGAFSALQAKSCPVRLSFQSGVIFAPMLRLQVTGFTVILQGLILVFFYCAIAVFISKT